MFSENSAVSSRTPKRFYLDSSMGLKKRFINVYMFLHSALPADEKSPVAAPQKQKLNAFERYLKSCNNDGHKLQENYYDSAKTKLMSRCVVDKNGCLDGPCLRYSDDGKTVAYGWYRKGKVHGKWVQKSSKDHVSRLVAFYDKKGERISPDTIIYEGKLNKFWYNAKTDYMHYIMRDGKLAETHKEMKEKKIAQRKKEGKSGVVKVDEKIAELRAKIHQPSKQEQTTTAAQASARPKVMYNAFKFTKSNTQE